MRQALLGVVLVAASFAGGAVVNGPGLSWARGILIDRLGLDDGGVEDVPSTTPTPEPIPPLAVEPSEVSTEPSKAEPSKATADDGPKPLTAAAPAPKPAALPTLEPEPAPPPSPLSDTGPDLSASPKPPDAPDPAVSPAATVAPASGDDWGEARRALKDAGVTRYELEGEIGGRVRLQCVIPVAGKRAVGQHFEAEGDDETRAARAVLKRIRLWRAAGPEGGAR